MSEIKYYAAQVAPEDQDPNFDECCWPGWSVTGNRHYNGFTTAEYDKLFSESPNSSECLLDEISISRTPCVRISSWRIILPIQLPTKKANECWLACEI